MTTKLGRHKAVEVVCEWCEKKFLARKQRVDKGQSRWCSREHYREWLKAQGSQRSNIGKENAIILWENTKKMYVAYWHERDTMQYKSEPWARWMWELNFGEIPDRYRVSYMDGNPRNNVLENLRLKSWDEYGNDLGNKVRGVPKSEKSKKLMSAAHKGKKLSEEHRRHIGDANRKKWEDGVYDTVHVGENHIRWRGGVKFLVYPREFYKIRRWIVERDKEKCQICGKDASRKGHVHHIDGNTMHNTEDNLVLLCPRCHVRVHGTGNDIASILAFRSKLEWNQEPHPLNFPEEK